MGIYEDFGVQPVINAAGTVTRFGGSIMAAEVLEAMREASQQFCVLEELHVKVGQKIAAMLGVEAAYVSSSSAAGLVLTAATCMAGTDPEKIKQLPDTTGMKNEIIVQSSHRIAYDQAMRAAGATLIEIEDDGTPPVAAMQAALNPRTAAIFYLAEQQGRPNSVSLEQAIAMAHAAGVPVIVDAASECPPIEALTLFWQAGADLVIFSGGKSLMGPQSSGLIIGRQELIDGCLANGTPFAAIGRPMKISREEIVAFAKALELYLARDHEADRLRWEAQTHYLEDALAGVPHINVKRNARSQTYLVPLLTIQPQAELGLTVEEIISALQDKEPRIVTAEYFSAESVVLNPHMLLPGQEQIVAQRCIEILTGSS